MKESRATLEPYYIPIVQLSRTTLLPSESVGLRRYPWKTMDPRGEIVSVFF